MIAADGRNLISLRTELDDIVDQPFGIGATVDVIAQQNKPVVLPESDQVFYQCAKGEKAAVAVGNYPGTAHQVIF